MRKWIARIVDWTHRDRLQAELLEELEFHRRHVERDNISAGAEPDEARHAAHRQIGNVTMVTEAARDLWSLPWLEQIQQNVVYALRGLRRSPGFATAAIVTLALGIGANAAMFSVVDQLMFRPYAYLRDPATVHRIYLQDTRPRGRQILSEGVEYLRYLDLARNTSSFSQLAVFSHPIAAIGDGASARERRIAVVSSSFWEFFEARATLGRFFNGSEDKTPRGADVAVLGYGFWQSEFGGRDVIGMRLTIGAMSATIVGVAPRDFTGVLDDGAPAVYVPVTAYAATHTANQSSYFSDYSWGWLSVMARNKPGVSANHASADASAAYWRSWETERAMDATLASAEVARPVAYVSAMKTGAGPDPTLEARTTLWLAVISGIVLLVACANVANLFLTRALRRQREIAVRLALGISRRRLMMQTLTESLVLSMLGAVAGLIVAQWGGAAIRRVMTVNGSATLDAFTDWRTLAFVVVLTLFVSVLTGVAPAWLSGRGDLALTLKAGPRDGVAPRSHTRTALMLIQSALSMALVVEATLVVRSLQHVRDVPMGYDAEHTLIVQRSLRGLKLDSAGLVAHRRAMLQVAQSIPGVSHVAWLSSVPLQNTSSTALFVPGVDSVSRFGQFSYQLTSADYFSAMGTKVVRGRSFTDADRDGAPHVAVVSASMANTLWPQGGAIGQCLKVRSNSAPCTIVVGVAEDIVQRENQLGSAARLHYYLPIEQARPDAGNHVLIRTRGSAASQTEVVRRSMQSVMPGQSYVTVRSLREVVEGAQRPWRLGATVLVAFGLLALAVAAIGQFGVMSYNVTQRMHELGVRIALGATRSHIIGLVGIQSTRVAIAGVIIGSACALMTSRWIEPLLFMQSARDPLVYGMVGGVMIVVALAAAVAPGVRAVRVDPNTALRSE